MYTLLVGKPPFETATLKETYARIKQVQYKTPTHISKPAMNMVAKMLQLNPCKRPSVAKLLKDNFFTAGKRRIGTWTNEETFCSKLFFLVKHMYLSL